MHSRSGDMSAITDNIDVAENCFAISLFIVCMLVQKKMTAMWSGSPELNDRNIDK